MKIYHLSFLIGLICLSSCSSTPAPKDIDAFPTTIMVATMEEEVNFDNNILYCPTLLLAWKEIQQKLPQPFQIEEQYQPLVLLNSSKGHLGALEEGDYEKEVTLGGNTITAKTSFKADLALLTPLEENPINMTFDEKKVVCFGGNGKQDAVMNQVEVMHYTSPEEFIIKITPKNEDHELLLYKTNNKPTSLEALYQDFTTKIQLGEGKRDWVAKDKLAVPALAFNIEQNYKQLVGLPFITNGNKWKVKKAWQKIALTFDKTGALVESKAEAVVMSRSAVTIPSRDLFFDNDFLLVAKKKAAQQPYLLVWVSDPAFMSPIEE